MSENPFGEGFDMNALLQQAQAMQEQLMAAQAELAEATTDGTVGGGSVTVTVSGTGELTAVRIAAGSFDGSDPDALADLGDLIVAAYRDAKANADALAQEKLGPLAGGLGGSAGGALGTRDEASPGDPAPGSAEASSPLGFGLPGGSGV